ncbi:MAG: VWA domain-containing protein [Spirochaetaceae bacterium]|jgi:Ca-activated chloride channel family protein|nr:VWA domain-containing protein [Spirochaetaceae bacterium]
MNYESPWAFLFLLLLPLLFLYRRAGGKSRGTNYSSLSSKIKYPVTLKQQLSSIPFYLYVLAFILLVFALARPREGFETIREVTNGIAINMAIDRSSSMGTPVKADGSKNRLDAVKEAFVSFVAGDGKDLNGREDDLIGLITFGRFGETLSPLTLSHNTLLEFTSTIQLIENREEDGTSIGDAVSLAAARLHDTEEKSDSSEYEIESRIIILLTDGQNNGGTVSPLDSAYLSAKWNIKLYTIGFGAGYYRNAFGMVKKIPAGYGVDEKTLKEMARITRGQYFSADSEDSLKEIYKEIDTLEKSNIESFSYKNYEEKFFPYALAALILIIWAFVLSSTWLRRIP